MGAQEPPLGEAEPRVRDLLMLEAELRLEQTDSIVQGVWRERAIYAAPAPEGKGELLSHFDTSARGLLGESAYGQLPACPRGEGLLWGRYVERLHLLKVALRARRAQLLEQHRGRA